VLVLIRPRPGGFASSAADFRVIQRDADLVLEHGDAGIVFDTLTDQGHVDPDRCARLARQPGGRQVVFHRAFDVTLDPLAALEQLIDPAFRRLLTSGQEETADNGAEMIAGLGGRAHRGAARRRHQPLHRRLRRGISQEAVAELRGRLEQLG
jgi:copper homeostasis protein